MVARSADGGMRDAESLLDRLLVAGSRITAESAEDALGLPPRDLLLALADALMAFDLEPLLGKAGELYRAGFAPRTVAEQLGRSLRDRLHELLGGPSEVRGGSRAESAAVAGEQDRLVRLIQALDDEHDRFTRRNDLYSLEVALIKAGNALHGEAAGVPAAVTASAAAGVPAAAAAGALANVPAAAPAAMSSRPMPALSTDAATTAQPTEPAAPATAMADEPPASSGVSPKPFSWHAVKTAAGPQLKAFLQPAAGADDGTSLSLTYDERYKFHFEQLLKRRAELESLIASVAGPGYSLDIIGPGGRQAGGGSKKA